jgi:hypothetical protein
MDTEMVYLNKTRETIRLDGHSDQPIISRRMVATWRAL